MHRAIAILGLSCLLIGPALAYVRLVPPLTGFMIFASSGLLGLIAVLWGIVGLLRRQGRPALVGLLLGLVPVAGLTALGMTGTGYPRINDITTDLDDPPALAGAPAYPDAFVPIVREGYPDLATLVIDAPPDAVFQAAMELATSRPGWTVELGDARQQIIHGMAETRLFRFRDDLAIRVRARGRQSVVDMRSRSRDGKGDLGANAARIRAFLVDLNARLARS
jgi:uncharacterized protein (DUF1499 family)